VSTGPWFVAAVADSNKMVGTWLFSRLAGGVTWEDSMIAVCAMIARLEKCSGMNMGAGLELERGHMV
jgi:hypothetical protein